MQRSTAVLILLALAGCYSQANRFEKDFDWEDRSARIAVLPTGNQAFDRAVVRAFIDLGYRETFIAMVPPYGEDLYPDFARADLVVRTSRDIATRGAEAIIQEGGIWIHQTRSPERSGSANRAGRLIFHNTAGGGGYLERDVARLIGHLLDPLFRYLMKE